MRRCKTKAQRSSSTIRGMKATLVKEEEVMNRETALSKEEEALKPQSTATQGQWQRTAKATESSQNSGKHRAGQERATWAVSKAMQRSDMISTPCAKNQRNSFFESYKHTPVSHE